MMAKIKTMVQLRETVIKALEDLEEGKIDITQAAAIAKLSETIVSGLKSEMQYAILTNQKPVIAFYGEQSGIALDKKDIKKLL